MRILPGFDLSHSLLMEGVMLNYLHLLEEEKSGLAVSLGYYYDKTRLHVWAIINDDDEPTEDCIIKAEAKLSAQLHEHHIYISTTILEKSDNIKMPEQYKPIKFISL